MKIINTKNEKQTKKLGENFARKIVKAGLQKNAVVVALNGNLGSGKTTFLQGFAYGLKIKEKILSPTFVIQKKFKIIGEFENFYHMDCYRIENPSEILDMDFKKIILNPKNIIAIEWPEKIKKYLPRHTIFIDFEFIDETKRNVIINYGE